jgi:hypothetical protein
MKNKDWETIGKVTTRLQCVREESQYKHIHNVNTIDVSIT